MRLRVGPSCLRSLFCYRLALCRREFSRSRLSTLRSAEFPQCDGGRILTSVRVFERRPVHVFADGLFDYASSDSSEVAVFA